ncbi:MAG: hypothetical protein CVU56_22425 [Deltaproteobacteria bacterium HGW-Deltaproteobacteria-14]|jgi:hypothetical protein|nr:MAG: hypothetical protein CVU56_22425 [Deltaproteobacteria bacterium HGW-Deltaproteobacteria-14]
MRILHSAARRALVVSLAVAALAAATGDARASCSDSVQNGAETGIDCGGACLACDGDGCSANADCRSGSCVDNVCAVVFSVDASQGTTAAQPGGAAVVVDPTLTIAGSGTLDGARVLVASGLVTSEDTLGFTNQSGISGSYSAATGVLTLTGTATVAAYQAALRTVTYRHGSAGGNTGDRVITFSLGSNGLALEATGHFYEYVAKPATGQYLWETARAAASARRYFGLEGYLVTVTSAAENAFVSAKLAGQGWMGASDAAVERTWRWVTGPEGLEDSGQGRYFFAQTPGGVGGSPRPGLRVDQTGSSCTAPADCESGVCTSNTCYQYDNWNGIQNNNRTEPNDSNGEDFGHFLINGLWNDYYSNNAAIAGYVVEYGGMPDDPPLVLQDNKTVRIVAVSCSNSLKDGTETDVDCGGSCGPCATGQGCAIDGDCTSFLCTGAICQAPSCFDTVRNGSETAVDCGGSCVADCADGLGCNSNGDCQSGKCTQNVCQAPTCSDSVVNNGETDVDCGGVNCPACTNGNSCVSPSDCTSGICAGDVCQSASCTDLTLNGDETDVDCGGTSCTACVATKTCAVANDCLSRVCFNTVCQAATCGDGVKNGGETGADCGGSCPDDCDPGEGCATGADCTTGVCSNSVCQAATCGDGVKNADETGVDCGGPTCGDCAAGGGCDSGADCVSAVCDGVCQAPTCGDGVLNGTETGVDCGGSCGATCATGDDCDGDGDCASGVCDAVCQEPTCSDGVANGDETDVDCGGPTICPACQDGQICAADEDCASLVCDAAECIAPSCGDSTLNGAETDIDCGGGACPACPYGASCDAPGDCVDSTCDAGTCACPADTVYEPQSDKCLAAGECGSTMTCELGATPLVFYGVVSGAQGPVGSIRCVRAVTGEVTCDADADGQLIVSDVLWCQP